MFLRPVSGPYMCYGWLQSPGLTNGHSKEARAAVPAEGLAEGHVTPEIGNGHHCDIVPLYHCTIVTNSHYGI
jgi:hypothetical protein